MPTRPLDVLCPKWEPASAGSRACRYYLKPETVHGPLPGTDAELPLEKEGPSPAGLCALPTEMLCVEWVRRNGTYAQQKAIGLAPINVARAPEPPLLAGETRVVRTTSGEAAMQMPTPFKPAKEIDPASLEALERAGIEVELEASYLAEGRRLALVPARTGRTDRDEMTFREAAVVRLIVDAFPGAHVVGYTSAPQNNSVARATNENHHRRGSAHMNLIWLDLETEGLDPSTCSILEVAVSITEFTRPFDAKPLYHAVLRCRARGTCPSPARPTHTFSTCTRRAVARRLPLQHEDDSRGRERASLAHPRHREQGGDARARRILHPLRPRLSRKYRCRRSTSVSPTGTTTSRR